MADVYQTDTPCRRGHNAPRYVKSRGCVQCVREDNLKQLAKNGEARTAASKNWRDRNRDYVNAQRIAYSKNNPERTMLNAARRAAKLKDVPFNLTLADILIPERCPVLGVVLKRGDGDRTGSSPSLDRIIPPKGYVKGNVMVISWRANRIKADASVAELDMIASFYRRLEASKN